MTKKTVPTCTETPQIIMISYFVGLYLISFSNQSLQHTEDGVIGSNRDQDVLEWIHLTFHDPALMRETSYKKTDMVTKFIFRLKNYLR